MLGYIPSAVGVPAYYHLDDVNDAGINSFTLTNHNSVAFNAGKFYKSADFGSSGTNKGLRTTAIDLSLGAITFAWWFQLLNTSSSNSTARFFTYNRVSTFTQAFTCFYDISGGTITIKFRLNTTGTPADATISFTADSNWHHVVCKKLTTTTNEMIIDGYKYRATGTGTGSELNSGVSQFCIGNANALNIQAWAKIEEFTMFYKDMSKADLYRYYSQYQGRLAA